ncbi:hypothetical protein [Arthrobacter oryzae]|uniref:Uncharacterized protein n=1 Tax=Arthrobacter oryzae TaxID=409290 RepID=A0A495FKV2_9MICC|nr:hypothetical protein [Arthrobacter oryzae]RKR29843.1 hypothetical protein C8D78_0159 [Arthrobacter oryzae]
MTAKLAVTVAVDMDATTVTLSPAGRLTSDNVRALLALVGRAGRVLPGFDVHLDPGQLHPGSPDALKTLSGAGVKTLTAQRSRRTRRGHHPDLAGRVAA